MAFFHVHKRAEKNDDEIDTTNPGDDTGTDGKTDDEASDEPDFGQYVAFITFMPPNLSILASVKPTLTCMPATRTDESPACSTRCSIQVNRPGRFRVHHV